jgi:hypothetical protein
LHFLVPGFSLSNMMINLVSFFSPFSLGPSSRKPRSLVVGHSESAVTPPYQFWLS